MKNIFYNPWSFSIFLIFAIMFGLSLNTTGQKAKITSQQLQELQIETQTLKANLTLKTLQASRSAQDFSKEKIGRDELLLIKPGDVVMELPPLNSKAEKIDLTPTQTPFQAWKNILR